MTEIKRAGELIKTVGTGLLDLVYPQDLYCICCGKIIDGTRAYRLCNECMTSIRWNTGRHCEKCGRPLAENDPGDMCFGCSVREASGQPHSFDKGYACAGYGACEQSMIFALKYGSRSDIGDTLGEMMYDRMVYEYGRDELSGMYDFALPVPTHREKKSKRGYNHAELMARGFAKRAGLRCEPDVVVRLRPTLPMKGLGPGERIANIRGAFGIRGRRLPQIAGARILLIDDIFTTGATIDEIARVLKYPDQCEDDMQGSGRHEARDQRDDITQGSGKYEAHDQSAGKHFKAAEGAARVDFLAFAGAADIVVS
ncbi:MAG: ComF family protein [Clostridiales bacterium]|nr:ComF family protein [Clostridiales bacterium]